MADTIERVRESPLSWEVRDAIEDASEVVTPSYPYGEKDYHYGDPQKIAAAICDGLGITRESAQAVRVAANALEHVRSKKLPHDALALRQLEMVKEARVAADALTALLGVAGR